MRHWYCDATDGNSVIPIPPERKGFHVADGYMPNRYDFRSRAGRVRYVREVLLELTTAELADALTSDGYKVSDASVSRYETGKRTIPWEYMSALADLAEVPLDWIAKGKAADISAYMHAIRKMRAHLDQLEIEYAVMGRDFATEPTEDDDVDLARQAGGEALKQDAEQPHPPQRRATG